MLVSAATACVFLALARKFGWGETVRFWDALTYPVAAACGASMALLATAGDLVESRFKRACGVKDSATFMPAGMGGFLDMFDSILFIPALAYLPIFYFCAHT
jgi:phosphatidate cytidylyltransferase